MPVDVLARILKGIVVAAVFAIGFGVVGLVVGAYYGGNLDVDFVWGGVRGYEAWGSLLGVVGASFGAGFAFGLFRRRR